jgi:hypothetical protein
MGENKFETFLTSIKEFILPILTSNKEDKLEKNSLLNFEINEDEINKEIKAYVDKESGFIRIKELFKYE